MTFQDPGSRTPPPSDPPTEAYTPQPHEPAETPTATTPVDRPSRAGAGRWAIALGIVAIAVGVTAAAAFLLTGQAAPSVVLGYAPADSVIYTELRLDLPGDQRQKVGEFLSKFPGFDDQSTLETKLGDVLDRIVKGASNDSQTYTGDIKPWFGGEIGMTVGELPPPDGSEFDGRFLLLVTVSDAAKAQTWLDDVLEGTESTESSYAGTTLTTFSTPQPTAYAIAAGKVLLAGDETSVKAALDTGGRSTLAASEGMVAARNGIKGDHLGFMYVDVKAYLDWFQEFAEKAGDMGMGMEIDESMRAFIPDWMAGALRAEDDAIAFDAVMPHVEANPLTENRTGSVAEHLPPTTLFLADAQDYGKVIDAYVDLYRDNPSTAEAFKQVEQAVGLIGGFDAVFGWMGESAIAVTKTQTGVEGGLVIVPTDRAKAESLLTSIRSLITLAGAQSGLEIEIREETYQGVTMTIVDLGSLADQFGGMAGLPSGVDAAPELAYAVTDGAVLVGANPGFVRAAIDAGAGPSLAEDGRYRALVERVGAQNVSTFFLDVTAIRESLEKLGADMGVDKAQYEREYKPYLVPFDAMVAAGVVGTEIDSSRFLITVK
jgi:hypothetical protein